MSILDELYCEWYEEKNSRPKDGGAEQQFEALWLKTEGMLEAEFSEELRNRIFSYMDEECRHDFEEGFRLGALLMLEVHPYRPSSTASAPHRCPTPML